MLHPACSGIRATEIDKSSGFNAGCAEDDWREALYQKALARDPKNAEKIYFEFRQQRETNTPACVGVFPPGPRQQLNEPRTGSGTAFARERLNDRGLRFVASLCSRLSKLTNPCERNAELDSNKDMLFRRSQSLYAATGLTREDISGVCDYLEEEFRSK